MEQKKIYESMIKVIADVDAVSKDRKSQGQFSFAYRGIDDVMNALHESFAKNGVFLKQDVLEHKMEIVVQKSGNQAYHHLLKVEFSFFAIDGSSVSSTVWGECIENGDKGVGKCMSYALKTCLLQTFLIPTEDESKDPDASNQPAFSSQQSAKTSKMSARNTPQNTGAQKSDNSSKNAQKQSSHNDAKKEMTYEDKKFIEASRNDIVKALKEGRYDLDKITDGKVKNDIVIGALEKETDHARIYDMLNRVESYLTNEQKSN